MQIDLKEATALNISLYNILGERVNVLYDNLMNEGENVLYFNETENLEKGLYFVQFQDEKGRVVTKRIIKN